MKGQNPRFVIIDEVHYFHAEDLVGMIRPDYSEPNCCEPCSAVWQVLRDLADEIEGTV